MHILYLFFAWPVGGTWSNMIASFEWVTIASFFVWLFRDRIGRKVAKFIHKHHFEAMESRLKDHITSEISKLRD